MVQYILFSEIPTDHQGTEGVERNPYYEFSLYADVAVYDNTYTFRSVNDYVAYYSMVAIGQSQICEEILSRGAYAMRYRIRNAVKDTPWNKLIHYKQQAELLTLCGTELKFKDNSELKRKLLSTGSHTIVYCSYTDSIMGIGYETADAIDNEDKWGQNMLGLKLMEIRKALRLEASSDATPTIAHTSVSSGSTKKFLGFDD